MEKAAPVGLGVDKNQAAFTNWLRAVANRMKTQLDQEERKLIDTL
jgi:polar amino acid transport system substrate-binding protein